MKTIKKDSRQRGNIILEFFWLILFASAFLGILSHLYENGQKEIQISRTIKK